MFFIPRINEPSKNQNETNGLLSIINTHILVTIPGTYFTLKNKMIVRYGLVPNLSCHELENLLPNTLSTIENQRITHYIIRRPETPELRSRPVMIFSFPRRRGRRGQRLRRRWASFPKTTTRASHRQLFFSALWCRFPLSPIRVPFFVRESPPAPRLALLHSK